jgi:exopolysaccharide production protein ExoZ
MENTLPPQKRFYLIQMLRGVACMLVVLMHATANFSLEFKGTFLSNIFMFGGAGVDIFFVISGFIIAYTNLNSLSKPGAIGGFVKKRIIRIYPIYWILITAFLMFQLLLPSFYKTHFLFGLTNLLNTYLLLPGHTMVNGVSWTLTSELFFYLLFIAAFLLPQKKYAIYLLSAYFIFLIIGCAIDMTTANQYLNLFISPMNIEFFLGIFVVVLIHIFPPKWSIPLLITGIVWFIFSAVCSYRDINILPGFYNRVLLFGAPSFVIILALAVYELHYKVSVPKPLITLGDASYSIYLFHLPVLVACYKILGRLKIRQHTLLLLFSCLIVITVTYLGIIIYQKIEKPLIKKLNRIFLK